MRTANSATCPACGGSDREKFFELTSVPTYVNFLWASCEQARACPRGAIELAACRTCGLISNVAFDPSKLEYRAGYENSLHFSSVFQEYAEGMADDLVKRFDLHGKTVVEIGCGRGDFLVMLAAAGKNRAIGYDPSHTDAPAQAAELGVEFVREYYDESTADRNADFICSRHTLEHVPNPLDMLVPLRRSIGAGNTPVFFEVPNGAYTLENCFIWDIIYEHTSYFTPTSLQAVFRLSGFDVSRIYETFGGQYLCIEAKPGERQPPDPPRRLDIELDRFSNRYQSYVEQWRGRLKELSASGQKVVLWGAGSKGVTFLNLFDGVCPVAHVVDVNPNKHGMHIAGAGQEIVPPERLRELTPDAIIVVNPIYKDEIARTAADLGLEPDFLLL